MTKGRFIVIEGVDGSGKQTQSQMLYERLLKENEKVLRISFPNYDSPSSSLVKMYLNGDFGEKPEDVNAYASSIFYAADRFATYRTALKKYHEDGYTIIADRYTTSNMVHQASKIDNIKEKDSFLDWLCDLEFGIFSLPKPDIVFFLDIAPEISLKLIRTRDNKITHSNKKDIHENNADYMLRSYDNAKYVAKKYSWTIVACTENDRLLSIESIHEKIFSALKGTVE